MAAQHLTKGRQVGISGELRWREWEQDGNKRQAVEINGRSFTFVGSRDPGSDDGASAGTSDFAPATSDDDIPF